MTDEITRALDRIVAGEVAAAVESSTLDFKTQGRSIGDTLEDLADAVACFRERRRWQRHRWCRGQGRGSGGLRRPLAGRGRDEARPGASPRERGSGSTRLPLDSCKWVDKWRAST